MSTFNLQIINLIIIAIVAVILIIVKLSKDENTI